MARGTIFAVQIRRTLQERVIRNCTSVHNVVRRIVFTKDRSMLHGRQMDRLKSEPRSEVRTLVVGSTVWIEEN
jgi:hypothetical protein